MTAEQGDLLANAAIQQAGDNADPEWTALAHATLRYVASLGAEFTTDDIWLRLEFRNIHTHEPRAMGAVMRAAVRDGLIEKTGAYVESSRPQSHARPIPVWRPVRNRSAA